jgi:uncharacterized protein related to proFAR isomerase
MARKKVVKKSEILKMAREKIENKDEDFICLAISSVGTQRPSFLKVWTKCTQLKHWVMDLLGGSLYYSH